MCAPFGVDGREYGVDKDEDADDLSFPSCALVVTTSHIVGGVTDEVVLALLQGLDQPNADDSSQALGHHVSHDSNERDLAGQEKANSHSWVNMTTRDSGGAVDNYDMAADPDHHGFL
ncbi:hypothetical protein ACFX1R_006610 [Malus domestica]